LSVVGATLQHLKRFQARYAPWISLALGVVARLTSGESVDFAPRAVAIVALAWLLPVAVTRWLAPLPEGVPEPAYRYSLRTLSPTVTVLLYKNVLFFLVPIWFGSAHLPSFNMVFPALLAGMALFTCFSRRFREVVLERPRLRVLFTALVLFAVLVPGTAVIAFTTPRTSIIISALIASATAWLALAPRETIFSRKGLFRLARTAIPVTALLGLAAPLFPPVPMVCHEQGTGTAVGGRQLLGRGTRFPRGTAKVYAWFAVTLPKRDRQRVAFQWYHDGVPVGRPYLASVEGGRKEGFRTWTMHSSPAEGAWRVDLLTAESSQLIARSTFDVEP
jgi:hypothetical protein